MFRDHFEVMRNPNFKHQLTSESLVAPLYAIAFVTGILDATTYATFNTFASNQTGNVVLMTIGIANAITIDLRNTAVSLSTYLVSAFIGGQTANKVGARTRWWLLTSTLTQILMLVIPTVLLFTDDLSPTSKSNQWIFLIFLAFSAGFQVALARSVGVPEIPSAMLSSPMVDLIIDPLVFSFHWKDPRLRARNRRIVYILSLVSGSMIGAFMHRYAGLKYVLLLAISLKVIILLWVIFIKATHPPPIKNVEPEINEERISESSEDRKGSKIAS